MAKIIIPEEGTRSEIVIYANYVEAINAFLTTPLTDSELDAAEVKEKSIPGHQRRRGPIGSEPHQRPSVNGVLLERSHTEKR